MKFTINSTNTVIHSLNNQDEAYAIIPTDNNNNIVIEKIFVDPKFRGQGIAGKLMMEIVNYAKNNNKKIICVCPYAVNWFEKHEEFQTLLL